MAAKPRDLVSLLTCRGLPLSTCKTRVVAVPISPGGCYGKQSKMQSWKHELNGSHLSLVRLRHWRRPSLGSFCRPDAAASFSARESLQMRNQSSSGQPWLPEVGQVGQVGEGEEAPDLSPGGQGGWEIHAGRVSDERLFTGIRSTTGRRRDLRTQFFWDNFVTN